MRRRTPDTVNDGELGALSGVLTHLPTLYEITDFWET
jgi:hypothetical protein